jgi:hypothetical protein
MVLSYEYTILTAIPDPRRGERVNVGIAIFREGGIDVRFKQASYKLRALTGQDWESTIDGAKHRLESLFSLDKKPKEILSEFGMMEPLLKTSGLGWLRGDTDAEYEEHVSQIIASLVALPRREKFESKSRINTEIAKELSRAKALARSDESIGDGKVVRNFIVDENEGLQADFALKNGKLHVASTLDLRKHNAGLGEAALKSIILDKAEKKFGRNKVVKIGVFAVDPEMRDAFQAHIDLLRDYAEELYNWQELEGRLNFKKALYKAMGRSTGELY